MTDRSLVHEALVNGPSTHVFLMGIACYPHLADGGSRQAHDRWSFGLGQLSSTSASARRLATWFIAEFDCPNRPLGSVALLLSERKGGRSEFVNPRTGITHSVSKGTLSDTRKALLAALRRARHPDDQFIFYFGGHGVSGGVNDFYLLRDFGADRDAPLQNMINYADFMAGMKTQIPGRQFFVFDACRAQDERATANSNGGSGLVLADPALRLDLAQVEQCSLHSTERDGLAYGRKDHPSVCAQAFERAMRGAAGKRSVAGWNITSGRVCEAMSDFQTLGFGPNAGIVQRPDTGAYRDFPLRRLRSAPLVPVFMRRSDGQSLEGAQITCRANGAVVHRERSVAGRYWEGALGIGQHDFNVVLADGSRCHPVSDAVSPTHLPIDVEVT
ncbi:hypothetical protein E0H70_28115 [Rhizobium leguminosarum bv. viciae]|nr:hypothetical protein E0H70_28115 [Rhizobium leguminosarum bv. viciae]